MKYPILALTFLLCCGGTVMADEGSGGTWLVLPSHFLGDLVAVFAFGLLAILLIAVGYKVFDWIAPCDYDGEITKGNVSAGIVIAAVVLGLCYVVGTVIHAVIH